MICPLSQQRSWSVRLGFGIQPNVYELRDGADEGARTAVGSHGEEDHLVASSGDHGSQRTNDAALAGAVGIAGYDGLPDQRKRGGKPKASVAGAVRESARLVPGTLLGPEHTPFAGK